MALPDTPLPFPFPTDSLYAPAPLWSELREHRPVAEVDLGGLTAWVVVRHDDVRQVLTDPRFSRALAAEAEAQQGGIAQAAGRDAILGMDPPEHTRLRRLVAGAFTVRQAEALRPKVRALVAELLDDLQAQPKPADLVKNFSLPLPMRVLFELLGVPLADQDFFRTNAAAVMGTAQSDPEETMVSLKRLLGYFEELVARKRAEPGDDLITTLVQTSDTDGDRLSEHELKMLCLGVLIAGYESTYCELNMFVLTLHRHPQEWARLTADPELVPNAVEELMRFAQLSPFGIGNPRVTKEAVELSGVTIPAGAMVLPGLIPANRDRGLCPVRPDELDLTREESTQHFGFGAGAHRCLGAALARVELQEALHGLVTRLPELRLGVPEPDLKFVAGRVVYTLESLPVTW
jgi:cytochrome P450